MRCERDVEAFVQGVVMAVSDDSDNDFVQRASAVFAAELFKPMFKLATTSPDAVQALIAEFRDKLDALDTVIAACPEHTSSRSPRPARSGGAAPHLNGHAYANGGRAASAAGDDQFDDVGRNQRSRLRELAILEALAREARPYALQQITAAIESRGFADTSGAIVSQLHRLKKLGIIDQPANGMYVITDQGLGHLRRLRTSFGGLISGN